MVLFHYDNVPINRSTDPLGYPPKLEVLLNRHSKNHLIPAYQPKIVIWTMAENYIGGSRRPLPTRHTPYLAPPKRCRYTVRSYYAAGWADSSTRCRWMYRRYSSIFDRWWGTSTSLRRPIYMLYRAYQCHRGTPDRPINYGKVYGNCLRLLRPRHMCQRAAKALVHHRLLVSADDCNTKNIQ